jgi:hypothetical protein
MSPLPGLSLPLNVSFNAIATARQFGYGHVSLRSQHHTHVVEEADEELGEVDAAIGNKVKAVVGG